MAPDCTAPRSCRARGRGFVSDGKDAKLLVFDLKTNAMLGKIDAADDADGIIYSPGDDRVLVSCGDASALLVLDPKADVATAKVEKIDLGGKPEFLAADGHGHVFVNLEDKDEVAAVDLKAMKVTARYKLGKGTGPAGLAIDAEHGRLFVGCHNSEMVVLDTADGHVLAELPIGNGNDACAFDDGTAFASCNDATMTLVKETSPGQFAVTATVKTAQGARTMAIDPSTHTAYLPTAEFEPAAPGQRRPGGEAGFVSDPRRPEVDGRVLHGTLIGPQTFRCAIIVAQFTQSMISV